jgi:hypothetical protein
MAFENRTDLSGFLMAMVSHLVLTIEKPDKFSCFQIMI